MINSSNLPNNLEKRCLVIQDIQTLKDIAGISDRLYEMNVIQETNCLAETEVANDLNSLKELSNSNAQLVCRLMKQYLYGNSAKVATYERLLSKLYFPMEISYYGNENTDLIVDAGQTCEIGKDGEITVLHFRNIELGEDARLVYHGNVDLSAKSFIQNGESLKEGNWISIGSNGGNGGKGGDGANGAPTQKGSDGSAGSNGTDGQPGGNSETVVARIEKIESGVVTVYSIGGNGGNGGNGGKGGNAGNGANITIYCNSPENIITLHPVSKGGDGGQGGTGGDGGQGGNGNRGKSGTTGTPGTSGLAGAAGVAGNINILPYAEQ